MYFLFWFKINNHMKKTEQSMMNNSELTSVLAHDPPLRAVRVFEAIARLGGINVAARELQISASAVSHQLKVLENYLRKPLAVRQGRRLVLNDEGREYYRSIRSAFSVLRQATESISEQSRRRQVTISLIPLFGMGWFIPRLPGFMARCADTEINVVYANHRNYLSDASDMSIRFGSGHWKGYQAEKLISGQMVPVCSQDFLRLHGHIDTAQRLSQMPLLHDEERSTWPQWFSQQGIKYSRHDGPLFEDGLLTLAAVQAGMGCALMREPMIRHFLEQGSLVKIFSLPIDDGRDYYLCTREDTDLSSDARRLQQWIREKATDH